MFTRVAPVVCGVDFSEESRHALVRAARLARLLKSPLHVVTAVEPLLTEAARLRGQTADFLAQVDRELRTFASGGLAEVPTTFEVGSGLPADLLLAAASSRDADLLVVGTRGLGRTARLFLGSATLRLLRSTDRPVLAVPAPEGGEAGAGDVTRLICGVDFSDASLVAAAAARTLAARIGATLTLAHVLPRVDIPVGWDSLVAEAQAARLADATARLTDLARQGGPDAEVTVPAGPVADALVSLSAKTPGAAIVVGLHGASHHRPGTTALRVLSTSTVPVLAIP